MKTLLTLGILTVALAGCRQRQPNSAGLLDADKRVSVTCVDTEGAAWGISIAGWNYRQGEGLPVDLKISRIGQPVLDAPGVVHFEENVKFIVLYKEGALQTEFDGKEYLGVLEIASNATLTELTCQL